MDMKDIRAIGTTSKKQRPKGPKAFTPSPARIARMCAKFRAKRLKEMAEPVSDDDCDSKLEDEADWACRGVQVTPKAANFI